MWSNFFIHCNLFKYKEIFYTEYSVHQDSITIGMIYHLENLNNKEVWSLLKCSG